MRLNSPKLVHSNISGPVTVADAAAQHDKDYKLLDIRRDVVSVVVKTTASAPTLSIQCKQSVNGTDWINLGSAITTSNSVTTISSVNLPFFKVDVTALTGGNISVWVA